MELVKSLKQSKLIKYIFLALMGSIALAISSKIRITYDWCCFWLETWIGNSRSIFI